MKKNLTCSLKNYTYIITVSLGHFEVMSMEADEDEHSIEMQLPYIAKVMQLPNIVILFPIHCQYKASPLNRQSHTALLHCIGDGAPLYITKVMQFPYPTLQR